jgi:predicted GNAT superfamily acetyltransferase
LIVAEPSPTTIAPADLAGSPALLDPLLALNNAHAQELSWLDGPRLVHLVAEAFVAARIGLADALLIAFDEAADYDSPNFLWFRSRFARFVYIDRVVVADAARGRGHASRLYADLFERARQAGHERVVCEVNQTPPNPGSDAFHATLGFEEVGGASIHGGAKTVRYLCRRLEFDAPA